MIKFAPTLINPPAVSPVSLVETKAHLEVDNHNDDDVMIQGFIDAATDHLDGWTGYLRRPIIESTWSAPIMAGQTCLYLPFGPVKSVTKITIGGQDLPAVNYSFNETMTKPLVNFDAGNISASSINGAPIGAVEFIAGYEFAKVPASIKAAILLLVGDLYEMREREAVGTTISKSDTYKMLVRRYRNFT